MTNLDPQELKDKYEKVNAKLKHEREKNKVLTAENDRLQAEFNGLNRKYRERVQSSASKGAIGNMLKKISSIITTSKDSDNVAEKIKGYHDSLDKKGYNHVWQTRVEMIQKVLESGEINLSRALSTVRRNEERKRSMGFDTYPWVINDVLMDLPWRPAASAYRSAVFEAVIDEIKPNTTKIIETGSGWGEHLTNIYLEGATQDIDFYACELELEGRICSDMLSALDPDFKLKSAFFDYLNPDWSVIPHDNEHTILLTAHSIEQVAVVHDDFFYGSLKLGKNVTGIHFEPMGWQTYPESEWTEISKKHYQRCMEKHYNTNLWPMLNKLQSENLIKIRTLKTNFIGLDYNPATLIIWEKI